MKENEMQTVVKLREGSQLSFPDKPFSNKPILAFHHQGKHTYIWFGNNGDKDGRCLGTLSGPKTLRKLANAILDQVGRRDK